MEQAQDMARVLVASCEQLSGALGELPGFEELEPYWVEIHRLENDADRLSREAVASLFAIRLEQAGVLGAGRLQGLVFLTILMTVGLQGLSAQPLAKALGLTQEDPESSVQTAPEAGKVLLDSGQQ